jgi:hypothetical protein
MVTRVLLSREASSVEWIVNEHDNIGKCEVVDGQCFTMGKHGKAADADHGSRTYSTGRHSDEDDISPNGSDGKYDGRDTASSSS